MHRDEAGSQSIKTETASQERIPGLQDEQPLPCSLVADHISISEIPQKHVSNKLSPLSLSICRRKKHHLEEYAK